MKMGSMAAFRRYLPLGFLLSWLGLVISACAISTPEPQLQVIQVTRLVPQTIVVTQVVTAYVPVTVTPLPPLDQTATSQAIRPPTATPRPPQLYYPLQDCAPSHIHIGDVVSVGLGGGRNALRFTADVTTGGNIIGYAAAGETLFVVNGPECSYGWLLWEVQTNQGLTAWTPETDGKRFFLVLGPP